MKLKILTIGLVIAITNPLLDSLGEPAKIRAINFSLPPTDFKGKGFVISLFKLLASYCGSQFVF